jgi:hypothetical protein
VKEILEVLQLKVLQRFRKIHRKKKRVKPFLFAIQWEVFLSLNVEWVGTRGLAYLEVWVVGRELALSGKTQS